MTKLRGALADNLFRILSFIVLAACSGQTYSQTELPNDSTGAPESPYRYRTLFKDIKNYVTAPIRWDAGDWIYFGAEAAAVVAAHGFDETVRRHFTVGQTIPLDGKDPHSASDALPAAVVVGATFFFAWNSDNDSGRGETWSMLEAAGLGSATSYVSKFAAGREAPNQTTNANAWLRSGPSFPSLHVTFATAIGTVLAESGNDDVRWIRRFLGYGIAAGTAYLRLKHNEHWLSDTVAGAAIGGGSAHFVLDHEHELLTDRDGSLTVIPVSGGAMLSYNKRLL